MSCSEPENKQDAIGHHELRLAASASEKASFPAFIAKEFGHHEQGVARINNGSFGSCPASVLASQAEFARLWLQQPDKHYFESLEQGILASRQAISALIGSPDVKQVVLVDNATVAVSMVLQKIASDFSDGTYSKGDAVLAMNFSYGAVKKAVKAYLLRAGARLVEVKLPFPVSSSEEILLAFEATLQHAKQQSLSIRFALIDHITSMPTVILPVKQLVRLCRRAGIDQIMVDGAHAIGSIDIDMQEIDADYYTSNLHKWLFAPPAVAFMFCKARHLETLHHPIISHHYENGLDNECAWIGTRDYSAQLAAASAIEFFSTFDGGIQAVQRWNHQKVVAMGSMLAKEWGTHLGTPPELCPSMIMVGLPNELGVKSPDDALDLRTRLRQGFGVEVPIYFAGASEMPGNSSNGPVFTAYARISHQIYNTLGDYMCFKDAVKTLLANS